MTEISGNKVRGHLETMILSVLEAGGGHGFEIVKRLSDRGCGLLNLKEGTVYPVLYRLESSGLLKSEWEEGDSGRRGPRRRIYTLTRKGRKQLSAGREQWTQFVSIVGNIVGATA